MISLSLATGDAEGGTLGVSRLASRWLATEVAAVPLFKTGSLAMNALMASPRPIMPLRLTEDYYTQGPMSLRK